VKVEPGVTWRQLQDELEKHGMMVANPLLPHPQKSALTSTMEREPMLITKHEYTENLINAEMVLPTGELFWTGTAIGRKLTGQSFTEALIPGTRLWLGAQGTLGIMTWVNLKAEFLPTKDKIMFMAFDEIADVVDAVYKIQYRMLGNECFVLNRCDFAAILADSFPDDFASLRDSLPSWTVILCLTGLHRRPEEKIAYEEEALAELATELNFNYSNTVAGIQGLDGIVLNLLRKPWPKETYWKHQYKGCRQDVFFHTTLERAPEFAGIIERVASGYEYPAADIGVYLQPIERARACFCQFGFYYNPESSDETENVKGLFAKASEMVINSGGVFTTPYGIWKDLVYDRTAGYTSLLKLVKKTYDPNNVLNPGKLAL